MTKKRLPFPDFHPEVNKVSKTLYESGHFTDALRKASIRLEEVCKKILKDKTGQEETGTKLMAILFSEKEGKVVFPIVNLGLQGASAKQNSFYFLFSGFAGAIRNTLAHNSDDLDDIEALYGLNIVSYLFYKLDKAVELNNITNAHKEEIIFIKKQKIKLSKNKPDFEAQLKQMFVTNEKIKQIPRDTEDKTLAKLSIEKIVNEILIEKLEEIGAEAYNYYFENIENIILIILQELYDNR